MSGYPGNYHGGGGGGYNYGQHPQQQQYYSPPQQDPQYNQQQQYGYAPPQQPPQGYYNAPSQPPAYGDRYGEPPRPEYSSHPSYNPSYPPAQHPTQQSNSYNQGNHQAPPPPPTQQQYFNHQQAGNYSFQYSNCKGKKKALLVGINYFNTPNQLAGCINDVKNMAQFLNQRYGFQYDDMVILTDDQRDQRSLPTRMNIVNAMRWLVNGAQPNDNLFFHYSGHGSQKRDVDGDEEDGYDETICPLDFKQAGEIVDDEMHYLMVQPLQPGVRLTAITDCCHSGSALDLPYIYSTNGVLKEPNLMKEAGQGLLGMGMSYLRGDMKSMIGGATTLFKKATSGSGAAEKSKRTKTSPADVIQWSGCKDNQTSADAVEQGQNTGAMSWAFRTALLKNPQQSYLQLLQSIRQELSGKYSQRPQLSSSHPIDTNLLFIM